MWKREFGPMHQALRAYPNGTWRDFYRGREGDDYRHYLHKQYRPFFDAIVGEVKPGDILLEVGCGLGTVTHNMHHFGPKGLTLVCMDRDQEMVRHARESLHGTAKVIRGDISRDTYIHANVIHGHGVLEHMDDTTIAQTLMAHGASGARVAIHYVPGNGHGKPSFGDERLYPLAWWQNNWGPTESFAFNGGKDYVLIWRFA